MLMSKWLISSQSQFQSVLLLPTSYWYILRLEDNDISKCPILTSYVEKTFALLM